MKRVFEVATLRVLSNLPGFELVYHGDPEPLIGYSDAGYGADRDTRRSTLGSIFTIGSYPESAANPNGNLRSYCSPVRLNLWP